MKSPFRQFWLSKPRQNRAIFNTVLYRLILNRPLSIRAPLLDHRVPCCQAPPGTPGRRIQMHQPYQNKNIDKFEELVCLYGCFQRFIDFINKAPFPPGKPLANFFFVWILDLYGNFLSGPATKKRTFFCGFPYLYCIEVTMRLAVAASIEASYTSRVDVPLINPPELNQ